MDIIDTSLIIERLNEDEVISEDATLISLIECPKLLEYDGFRGRIIEPAPEDLRFAYELQKKLTSRGRMRGAADLIIAAICIHLEVTLFSSDRGFAEIARISELKFVLK